MCSKHVEAWNKLNLKQTFCASSWLITEINDQNIKIPWKNFYNGNDKSSKIIYFIWYTPLTLPWCKTVKLIKEKDAWFGTLSSETRTFEQLY